MFNYTTKDYDADLNHDNYSLREARLDLEKNSWVDTFATIEKMHDDLTLKQYNEISAIAHHNFVDPMVKSLSIGYQSSNIEHVRVTTYYRNNSICSFYINRKGEQVVF